jgi:hypothetical protein
LTINDNKQQQLQPHETTPLTMSATTTTKYEPPTLTFRSNFDVWKLELEDWLRRNEMWESVFAPTKAERDGAKHKTQAFAVLFSQ